MSTIKSDARSVHQRARVQDSGIFSSLSASSTPAAIEDGLDASSAARIAGQHASNVFIMLVACHRCLSPSSGVLHPLNTRSCASPLQPPRKASFALSKIVFAKTSVNRSNLPEPRYQAAIFGASDVRALSATSSKPSVTSDINASSKVSAPPPSLPLP